MWIGVYPKIFLDTMHVSVANILENMEFIFDIDWTAAITEICSWFGVSIFIIYLQGVLLFMKSLIKNLSRFTLSASRGPQEPISGDRPGQTDAEPIYDSSSELSYSESTNSDSEKENFDDGNQTDSSESTRGSGYDGDDELFTSIELILNFLSNFS